MTTHLTSGLLARWAILLLILSAAVASNHNTPPTSSKRHVGGNGPNKPALRRPNPFHPQESSSSSAKSLLSVLAERLVKGSRSSRTKRDPKLGPGPGYAESLKILKKSRRREARIRDQKRQAASATASAPAAAATTASANSSSQAGLWVLEDMYAGPTFFNYFSFYNWSDPTHGQVNYVSQQDAFGSGLAYVNGKGQVIMKADNTTVLQQGQNRKSVRIGSTKTYTGGLFLLDVERTPFGCGVWPAFWTSSSNWPYNGEIDIYEGVHLSTNNQMTWHTDVGCTLKVPGGFSGYANTTDCNAFINNNEGCAVTDQSYSSSGATLKNIGGGVFAMKWDATGISVWFFPRSVVPNDITNLVPDPSNWGQPQAHLSPDDCNIAKYFQQHQIIFNITFCGDWAGQTYLTSGCPGTCEDHIMAPSNFDETIWIINTLKVYTNAELQAGVLSAGTSWKRGDRVLMKLGIGLLLAGIVGWL